MNQRQDETSNYLAFCPLNNEFSIKGDLGKSKHQAFLQYYTPFSELAISIMYTLRVQIILVTLDKLFNNLSNNLSLYPKFKNFVHAETERPTAPTRGRACMFTAFPLSCLSCSSFLKPMHLC